MIVATESMEAHAADRVLTLLVEDLIVARARRELVSTPGHRDEAAAAFLLVETADGVITSALWLTAMKRARRRLLADANGCACWRCAGERAAAGVR
jgi:hypothetical protein